MKIVLALACLVAATAAQFNRAGAFASFGGFPKSQYRRPSVTVSPAPAPVAPSQGRYYGGDGAANIVRFDNEVNADGSYSYAYQTDNGIAAQEQGYPRNFGGVPPVIPSVAQGSFSWTSPEGQPIAITYVADENGYQPQGDAIPTPPPIPPQIARALEYLRSVQRLKK